MIIVFHVCIQLVILSVSWFATNMIPIFRGSLVIPTVILIVGLVGVLVSMLSMGWI
jgi:hypothetical protein